MVVLAMAGGACTRPAADASAPSPTPAAVLTTTSIVVPAPSPSATTTTTLPATTTSTSTTSTTSTTSSTSTTTTTTTLPLDVYDATCVVLVQAGDTINLIAERLDDETVLGPAIQAENGLVDDVIHPGQLLDVCVDNGLNDITGESIGRNSVLLSLDVVEQQTKLNELFAGLGIRELLVDGISGPVTRQRLCAARLALGLPVSLADMVPGSDEENLLMAATTLPLPFTTALASERWILIDRTCQIMFVGEGVDRLVFVFPTSTGQPGYETRNQDRSRMFRFNPALGNGGWHNSLTYPVADDNPLNGNMYKPLYFDRGQAIHGANNVPTSPASKGCARLRVEHQDALVAWLGLADSGPTTDRSRINVTVNVQGTWLG
jgi:LysM repeat protein